MPRLAFDKASLLIFSGDDRYRFIDGLSSNKIDFSTQEIINTLVLTTKAKIMAQLHLFMLNDMLISITISENNDDLILIHLMLINQHYNKKKELQENQLRLIIILQIS